MRRSPLVCVSILSLSLVAIACSAGNDKGSDSTPADSTPVIDSVSPASAHAGAYVVIAGEHFGSEGVVTFGGVTATLSSWSGTYIGVFVPSGAFPGARDIEVITPLGSTGFAFTVVLPRAIYVNDDIPPATGPNSIEALAVAASGWVDDIAGSPRVQGVNGPGYGGADGGTLALAKSTRRVITTGFGTLTSWDIEPTTGALTSAGTIALGGNYLFGLVVNADGTRAYVADFDNSRVFGVAIATNGALSALSGSPYDAGASAGTARLSFSVDGTRLYASNESTSMGSLHGWDIAVDGSLTPLAASPYDQPDRTYTFARAPNADRWYLGNDNYIAAYVPDAEGDLSENVALRELMPGNAYLSFDGEGDRLFALTDATPAPNQANLHVFDVAASGELVAIAGSPFTLTGFPTRPTIVRASADGAFVLLVDTDQAEFHIYSVGGVWFLWEVTGSPFPLEAASQASGLAVTF